MALTPAPPVNGFAVAALVLGIVGVVALIVGVVGSIPVVYFAGPPCGVLAFVFGIVGRRRSMRMGAPNRGTATAGIIVGLIAVALGTAGIVFVLINSSEELLSSGLDASAAE